MASPIALYVSPNKELKIELKKNPFKKDEEPDSSFKPFRYKIANLKYFHLKDEYDENQQEFIGFMSPLSRVTLPRASREKAGIPGNALWCAYLHPPSGLGKIIDWQKYKDLEIDDDGSTEVLTFWELQMMLGINRMMHVKKNERFQVNPSDTRHRRAAPHISAFGGYIYFDELMNQLSINVITMKKTRFLIKLAGPFPCSNTTIEACMAVNRIQHLPLEIFQDGGYVASAWTRPLETFQSKYVTESHTTSHGKYFIGFRCEHTISDQA